MLPSRRYLPYAFSEHSVAMVSTVLESNRAMQMSILIMRAFVKLSEVLASNLRLSTPPANSSTSLVECGKKTVLGREAVEQLISDSETLIMTATVRNLDSIAERNDAKVSGGKAELRSRWPHSGKLYRLHRAKLDDRGLARNADWHRLVEIYALTDTLILDEESLYTLSGSALAGQIVALPVVAAC